MCQPSCCTLTLRMPAIPREPARNGHIRDLDHSHTHQKPYRRHTYNIHHHAVFPIIPRLKRFAEGVVPLALQIGPEGGDCVDSHLRRLIPRPVITNIASSWHPALAAQTLDTQPPHNHVIITVTMMRSQVCGAVEKWLLPSTVCPI